MKKNLSLFAAAAVFATVSATAATQVFTASPNPLVIGVGASDTATFASFDTTLGTLTKVTVRLTAIQRGDITIENTDTFTQTMNAELAGSTSVSIDSGNFGATSALFFDAPAESVDAGVIHNYGTLTTPVSISINEYTSGLSFFESVGADTRVATMDASALWGVQGDGSGILTFDNLLSEGIIEVTYEYSEATPAPEPSSALLGLLGAGALVFRRKRA